MFVHHCFFFAVEIERRRVTNEAVNSRIILARINRQIFTYS